jgi:hypothetical protein
MKFLATCLAVCNACGLPIPSGLEVKYNQRTYHPGCAGRIVKEKKDAEAKRPSEQKSAA